MFYFLSNNLQNIITINDYLEDPDFKSVEEIALYCGITQKLVIDFVETKQLSGIYSKRKQYVIDLMKVTASPI